MEGLLGNRSGRANWRLKRTFDAIAWPCTADEDPSAGRHSTGLCTARASRLRAYPTTSQRELRGGETLVCPRLPARTGSGVRRTAATRSISTCRVCRFVSDEVPVSGGGWDLKTAGGNPVEVRILCPPSLSARVELLREHGAKLPVPRPRQKSVTDSKNCKGPGPDIARGEVRPHRPLQEGHQEAAQHRQQRIAVLQPAADLLQHGEERSSLDLRGILRQILTAGQAIGVEGQVFAAARAEVVAHAQSRVELEVLVAPVARVVPHVDVRDAGRDGRSAA